MKFVTLALICCLVAVSNGQGSKRSISLWSAWSSSWSNWNAPPSWTQWASSWTTWSPSWSSSWTTWSLLPTTKRPQYPTMKTTTKPAPRPSTGLPPKPTTKPLPASTPVPKTTPGPSPPSASCGQSYYTETEGTGNYAVPQGIIGGTNARMNEFPYQAAITFYGGLVCGGSVVSNRHILTAAHCISGTALGGFKVILGEHTLYTLDAGEQSFALANAVIHPKFSEETGQFDFAVLVLATNITFDKKSIRPVCLPETTTTNLDSLAGKNAIISGWGLTQENGKTSTILQKATVPILTVADCKTCYEASRITDDMICAGNKDGKDACQGDSGGPMVVVTNGRFYQYGVTSWGDGCGRKGIPGVYARVTQEIDWIKSTMASN